MPDHAKPIPARRRRLSRELLFAAAAVATVAIALAQPAVMSLAGLNFARQRASASVDSLAVGSIAATRYVHGLAGVIKPLRLPD